MSKEIRKCLNCGNEFGVRKHIGSTPKKQLFCKECSTNLSNWDRKAIKMKVFPELREQYLWNRRKEFMNDMNISCLVSVKKTVKHKTQKHCLLWAPQKQARIIAKNRNRDQNRDNATRSKLL